MAFSLNRQRWIVAAIWLLMLSALACPCRAGFLDGTAGHLKVVPEQAAADKGAKEFSDKIAFSDGKFSSSFFLEKGFKPAVYRGETEPNEAEFEIEQTSDSEGVITWLGEIRGKKILGRLMWHKKDGLMLSYDFEGTKD